MADEEMYYLMKPGISNDFFLGKTTDKLNTGDFVKIDKKIYLVVGNSDDRGLLNSRRFHEVYLDDDLGFIVNYYTNKNPELSKLVAEFLKNPRKFRISKIRLIKD